MSKDVNNISNRGSVQKATQDLDLEYKKKKIAFTIQVSKLNTSRVQTPDEMKERLDKMFELCIETGNIPTYECMAVACGIPIRTFYDMKQGEFEGYKRYSQIIKNAKDTIALMESSMAVDGKIPANVWIFRAKNYLRNARQRDNRGCSKPVRGYSKPDRGYTRCVTRCASYWRGVRR